MCMTVSGHRQLALEQLQAWSVITVNVCPQFHIWDVIDQMW